MQDGFLGMRIVLPLLLYGRFALERIGFLSLTPSPVGTQRVSLLVNQLIGYKPPGILI